jgi:hypothetical protein
MKIFMALIAIINTVIFSLIACYTFQTYKVTERNIQSLKSSVDTMNVRLKSINSSLDDKLYGIINGLPKH